MLKRLMLLGTLIISAAHVSAEEKFILKINLTQGDKTIERINAVVSDKEKMWSKGLLRSYLRLRCNLEEPGKLKKLYSTEKHFAGLRLTHQLSEDNVDLTIVKTDVKPRLTEIRALEKNKCKDLSPVVSSTTLSISLPAKNGASQSQPFGANMILHAALEYLITPR